MKKVIVVIVFVFLFINLYRWHLTDYSSENVLINYNGNSLMISIDGSSSDKLPTSGAYYLASYTCDNTNTVVSWDNSSYELKVSNSNNGGVVACDLEFKSNPPLNQMPVGSYVAYIGTGGNVGGVSVTCKNNGAASSDVGGSETEAPNSCLGQNAREDLDKSNYTYGYCHDKDNKYYVTGWRIAYVDGNNNAVIVSAGSPECSIRESSISNKTYIKKANANALKYCNTDYVDGSCTCIDSDGDKLCDYASTDAWAISDKDFYYMTKAISKVGKGLTAESILGDSGGALGDTLYCNNKYSYQECGYNNDLIDNGGNYWFATRYEDGSFDGIYWYPKERVIHNANYTYAYGLRPVISLSSTVYVIGGTGKMDDPYIIAN